MRILLDEDVAVQAVDALQHVLHGHQVHHVHSLGWSGKKDLFVLRDAAAQDYQVLVTNDGRQLDDPVESSAIKRSGLHHVRFRQRYDLGLAGLALALGALVSAMTFVLVELANVDGQRLIRINGLDPGSRYQSIDPATDPPKYWPR